MLCVSQHDDATLTANDLGSCLRKAVFVSFCSAFSVHRTKKAINVSMLNEAPGRLIYCLWSWNVTYICYVMREMSANKHDTLFTFYIFNSLLANVIALMILSQAIPYSIMQRTNYLWIKICIKTTIEIHTTYFFFT